MKNANYIVIETPNYIKNLFELLRWLYEFLLLLLCLVFHKSLIKEKKKKHDKIVLLVKSKLVNIEVLVCRALIDSNISHDEFVLISNVLKEYEKMKK